MNLAPLQQQSPWYRPAYRQAIEEFATGTAPSGVDGISLSRDSMLAAIPGQSDGTVSWLFTDRHSPSPRRLRSRPDPLTEPEASRLWDVLHARLMGELPANSDLPRM